MMCGLVCILSRGFLLCVFFLMTVCSLGGKRPLGDVETVIREVHSALHSQGSNYVKTVFRVVIVKNIPLLCVTGFLYARVLRLKLLLRFVMMSLNNVSK